MIDRNLKYKEETYNIKGVVNLIVLFAAISIFFIRDVPIKTIVITIVIISILVGTIEYVITENKRKKYQSLIKTYGCYCISGIIKDHYKNIFQNRAGFTKTRYYIIVEYEDPYTNELQQYTTPALNFNPEKDLGSFQCKLYIKEDQIYVTNFVKRGINQENIWHPGQKYLKLEKEKDKNNKIIISILILLIIIIFISIISSIKNSGL